MSSTIFRAPKMLNFLLLKTPSRNNYLGQIRAGTGVARFVGYDGSSMQQGLRLISFQGRKSTGIRTNMENKGNDQVTPPGPDPPRFSFPRWSIFSAAVPVWKQKWDKLQTIEGQTEIILDEIEDAAKAIENVANATDKIAEDLAEQLPDDSKLKQAVKFVEHVAEATAQDAHLLIDFIDKVEEVKQDVEELEDMVEPVIDKITKNDPEEKDESK